MIEELGRDEERAGSPLASPLAWDPATDSSKLRVSRSGWLELIGLACALASQVQCLGSVTDRNTRCKAHNARACGSLRSLRSSVITRAVRPAIVGHHAALVGVLVLAFACAEQSEPTDKHAPLPISRSAFYALGTAERIAEADRVVAYARAERESPRGVSLARTAAQTALDVVRLGGPARYLTTARTLLDGASRREGVEACESGLDLARLLATRTRELGAAHATAERVMRAHFDDARAKGCVESARLMVGVLGEHRTDSPSSAAPTDVNDAPAPNSATDQADLDDAPDTHEGSEVIAEHAVLGWAAEQARPSLVRLQEVAVYGGAPSGSGASQPNAEARVVLRFDEVAVYRRGELPAEPGEPRRLFLDLDGASVSREVAALTQVGSAGLRRIHVAELSAGQVRVTFEVEPTTAYRLFFLSEPYRVVMDFRDEAARARSARAAHTIVLDPGHGGEQPGAKGPNGVREAETALSLALRARKILQRALPDTRIVMTRDRDVFVTLEERSALANALDADLFVSIHLNASDSPDDKGGVSTYVLDSTTDAAAMRLAAQENGTQEAGVSALQLVLASLYRKEQVGHSLDLAHEVQEATLRAGRQVLPNLNDRGVKRALFYVLVGARMPAILVEASFITRAEEAIALATDEYRQRLAEGIALGITRYWQREHAPRPARP